MLFSAGQFFRTSYSSIYMHMAWIYFRKDNCTMNKLRLMWWHSIPDNDLKSWKLRGGDQSRILISTRWSRSSNSSPQLMVLLRQSNHLTGCHFRLIKRLQILFFAATQKARYVPVSHEPSSSLRPISTRRSKRASKLG